MTRSKSDDKKDFTTLGISSESDPSEGDAAPDDINTFGTLGLGAIPLKGAPKADKPETEKPQPGKDEPKRAAPSTHPNRLQELRRQRNAKIQTFLGQAESALQGGQLKEGRAAIEQAVLLSPDNPKVISVLEAVEQAEQAKLEAERARRRDEETRRKAEQTLAAAAVSAEPSTSGGVESPGGDEPAAGESRQSSLADLRLGDIRVLAGLGVIGVVVVVLMLSLLMGSSDEPPVTASRESVPPAVPALPPPSEPLLSNGTDAQQPPPTAEPSRPTTPRTASRSFRPASRQTRPVASQPSERTEPSRTAAPAPIERAEPTANASAQPASESIDRAEPPANASTQPVTGSDDNPDGPVRIAGNIARPVRTTSVPPRYPAEARETGVQGIVVLETVISAAGQVTDVKVLRSVDPLLDAAALTAARQWAYAPTVIDGISVPVVMTETVRFRLDEATDDASPELQALVDRTRLRLNEATDGASPAQSERSSPRPTAAPALAASSGAVRISGDIPRPTRTTDIAPQYPDAAIRGRIGGIVILETEIGTTGQMTNVRVLRSVNPLLDQAAVDAALQWVYTPTVLEGKAVPVVMTETVNFVLPPSIEDIDPRSLIGLSMNLVRNRVGPPQTGDDTTWTYQTADGQVILEFAIPPDGSLGDAQVSRVESPQGTVSRLPR